MNAVRVETTVESDGELHLTELNCPAVAERKSRPSSAF